VQRLHHLSADLAIDRLPELVRPEWSKALLCALTIFAGLAIAIVLTRSNSSPWLPAFSAMIATGYIGAMATRKNRTEFPNDLGTVADLARWVMIHKAGLATQQTTGWTRDQVAPRVREIVVNILGCESIYREDARFVEDLGLS
jgi:hypothetical protein